MKTAISIPGALNQNIEDFLQTTKMTRSEFFQRAARCYLEQVSARAVTANLNQVYDSEEAPCETAFRRAALSHFRELLEKEEW
jgi:metal-responsive CopG/Arc/MetJ family transcriptional regulator